MHKVCHVINFEPFVKTNGSKLMTWQTESEYTIALLTIFGLRCLHQNAQKRLMLTDR